MGILIAMTSLGSESFRKYMQRKYITSLLRAGARSTLLMKEEREIERCLDECDGLLLPGGADIEPARYGEEKTEACGETQPPRDAFELELVTRFLETGRPIFCICRGIQLLNVALGGTLHQDIASPLHSDFKRRASGVHTVDLADGSRLRDIVGVSRISVNSMHHQAIKTLGNGLRVSARSEDGFVEGVELEGHPFCLAVQWHPEHMTATDLFSRKIFSAFVEDCR